MPTKKAVAKKSKKIEIDSASRRVVYLAGCRNCCHLPFGVNAVLTVLIAVIFTLSAMLMAASVALNGQGILIGGSSPVDSVASR